jgi:hypothetical protein
LPGSGFLHQISETLADLKVVWRVKSISDGLPISDGFLVDLTKSARALFCLVDLVEFWWFWPLAKSNFFLQLFGFSWQLIFKSKLKVIFCKIY